MIAASVSFIREHPVLRGILRVSFALVAFSPALACAVGSVDSLTLIDAVTNQPVVGFESLPNNATVNLALLPNRELNVRANVSGQVGSVGFVLDQHLSNQNVAPYALCNDTEGNYLDCGFQTQTYTIKATPYQKASQRGPSGQEVEISVTFIDQPMSIDSYTLIDASTGQPVAGFDPIPQSATINLAEMPSQQLNIRANVSGTVGSTELSLNSATQIQSVAPFAVCGDSGGFYYNCGLQAGNNYSVSGTPYTGPNKTGQAGLPAQISFQVINQSSGPNIAVTSLTLIDADTDQPIAAYDPIPASSVINLSSLPSRALNVRANYSGNVGSVQFKLNGTPSTQSSVPFALCNDSGGDYYDCGFTTTTYNIEATPYEQAGLSGQNGTKYQLSLQFVDPPVANPQVVSMSLINADTDQPISGYDPLPASSTIDLNNLPTRNLNIRANTSGTVGSVHFNFNSIQNTENESPFAACGQSSGNYADCGFMTGSYSISGTPFELQNQGGVQGSAYPISIQFTDSAIPNLAVTDFTLINADTDLPISGYDPIPSSSIINLATLPTRHLNVRANVSGTVGSVGFQLNSTSSTQNVAPFALCGDSGGDYYDCGFQAASYSASATPYEQANLGGQAGTPYSMTLQFIDQPVANPQVVSFSLINADTDQPISGYDPLPSSSTIDLNSLPTENLNIRANTAGTVGSIRFSLNSANSTENSAPYALCGQTAGNYANCNFSESTYSVGATPYELSSMGGQSGNQSGCSVTFTRLSGGTGTVVAWANDGADKVAQGETRARTSVSSVLNSVWDGTNVNIFGAKNEVISFNVILEAGNSAVNNLSVEFNQLTGPGSSTISSVAKSGNNVFDYTGRNIEIFFVRYLKIEGLSALSYGTYDERHIPKRFQRPWSGQGIGSGSWTDRPDHDKYYPDIAAPIEWHPLFNIAANQNQSIWVDIYIPKTTASGLHTGTFKVKQNGSDLVSLPVQLDVRDFTLPDTPNSKTMLFLGYQDINRRYTGVSWPNASTTEATISDRVRDRHFQMAHRHKISMIDQNLGATVHNSDQPRPEWVPRLNGQLFTPATGYEGPGQGVGNGVYSIGTYSSWSWKGQNQSAMEQHTDAWEQWFQNNSPQTERFLYLIDESTNYTQTEQWASWVANNPGVGGNLQTFATAHLPDTLQHVPSLNIAASWFAVAPETEWQNAANQVAANPNKKFYMYNGKRPASGSFATEDDGVALRELSWAQYKKGIDRWFFWEGTYYNDFQGGRGQTNVFQNAQTFGGYSGVDPVRGKYGWNYSNGDGVLFYPGTDTVYPSESYGYEGPVASLRLKHWRRGIQDIDYVSMAAAINPVAVQQIVDNMVPKALWEYDVTDPQDPTWVRADISWSIDPDDWEQARKDLADIIENAP